MTKNDEQDKPKVIVVSEDNQSEDDELAESGDWCCTECPMQAVLEGCCKQSL